MHYVPPPAYGTAPETPSAPTLAPARRPSDGRAPWWPSWVPAAVALTHPTPWHVVQTLALVALCFFSSAVAWAFEPARDAAGDAILTAETVIGALVLFTLPWALVVRRRWPVQVTLASAAVPVLIAYDSLTTLVALVTVVATRRWRTVTGCIAAAALATAAAVRTDAVRPTAAQVWSIKDGGGTVTSAMTLSGFVTLGLVALAVPIALGYVIRARHQAEEARRQADDARRRAEDATDQALQTTEATTAVLHDRMSRQEEREMISREVHDTVAYALGQISLQASALEVGGSGDDDVAEVARRMRSAAQKATAELRSLLSLLRTGGTEGTTFEDLTSLLANLRDQGSFVNGAVFVSEPQTAASALTRATYRIVQESLINALKHAPGQNVDVTVRAAPATGVSIRTVNRTTTTATPPAPGTGSGLTGMTERAERLGGHLTAREEDGRFVVEAHLPWVPLEAA